MSFTGVQQRTRRALAAVRAARLREVRATFRAGSWQAAYRRRLMVTDGALVALATFLAVMVNNLGGVWPPAHAIRADQMVFVVVVAAVWPVSIALSRGYDVRVFASGPREFERVFNATLRLFALLALGAFLLSWPGLRSYLVVAFPVGLVLLLVGRWQWRGWLQRRRARGESTTAVLAVGLRAQTERLVRELNERPSGYRVVGVCSPPAEARPGEEVLGVPVLGDLDGAATIAAQVGADCVAVAGSDRMTAEAVRRLGWELEPVGVDLMLMAELADVAGPRITVTPEQSVSLLHVDAPRFVGPKYVAKTLMDWTGAALITAVVLPVLVVVALVVAVTSAGPVFYSQDRVGRGGHTFRMLKFRTMRVGADREDAVLHADHDGAGVLFKRRDDPRVTRAGRVLRRYSLDELPQLFNVLAGQMSLVGPRPPLPQEVTRYEARMRRRLLVKPGITGLWQVGGRSDLSWEEAVRLDVYYAENWTPFGDLLILARTAKVVLGAQGAY
ncbi:sugar transferase [Isoptericola croceus]|uniref:sugar transferase n=1 Tax=Isoptericola croceus TaxID=3031406 RepID=UPI0023F827F7|nr:sugar transferase [Isoptericola croceus]